MPVRTACLLLIALVSLSACRSGTQAIPSVEKTPLVVFAAGSLILPFDALEAAFETEYPHIDVLAEYHGSIQVIRHATELHEPIDVVTTADAALIPMLMYQTTHPDSGLPNASWFIRFATNKLALAYHAESKYAAEITSENWMGVIARPDVRVGLADPRFDASGYRALMAFALAERSAEQYTYFDLMYKDQFTFPVTIFRDDALTTISIPEILETKTGAHIVLRGASIELIALLQSGDLDYAFEYESVILQHGLEMFSLPDAVNLGTAALDTFYHTALVKMDFQRFASLKPVFWGEQIAYGITIPAGAPHPAEAALFIKFLLSPAGRAIMEDLHQPMFSSPSVNHGENLPLSLQALALSEEGE